MGSHNDSLDEHFMREAIKEAEIAASLGEVPVGAVIVQRTDTEDAAGAGNEAGSTVCAKPEGVTGKPPQYEIVGRGHNLTETGKDPTLHAEMIAIRSAAKTLGGWRLPSCTMYVTLEPCSMCAGALIWSRMERLVIGASDPKAGACGSVFDIVEDDRLNHQISVERGVLETESAKLLKTFFAGLRAGS